MSPENLILGKDLLVRPDCDAHGRSVLIRERMRLGEGLDQGSIRVSSLTRILRTRTNASNSPSVLVLCAFFWFSCGDSVAEEKALIGEGAI